jgi:hypothetical protein
MYFSVRCYGCCFLCFNNIGLKQAQYETMTDIQRASLPHSLCGRDVLGAARTGSGKTLGLFCFISLYLIHFLYFLFYFI